MIHDIPDFVSLLCCQLSLLLGKVVKIGVYCWVVIGISSSPALGLVSDMVHAFDPFFVHMDTLTSRMFEFW